MKTCELCGNQVKRTRKLDDINCCETCHEIQECEAIQE